MNRGDRREPVFRTIRITSSSCNLEFDDKKQLNR